MEEGNMELSTLMTTLMALPENKSEQELPPEMQFNKGHMVSIIAYSILMVISSVGNFSILIALNKEKKKSRLTLMLTHLAIADLCVTLLMMPLEISWAITVQWRAGDAMCRIMAFFRIFGLFLSGFVIICITVDRYIVVMKPMSVQSSDGRSRIMLAFAWVFSVIFSFPQVVVFHVETHENFTDFEQCVTFNAFPSKAHEMSYLFFDMLMMYFVPLVVIIYCYVSIITELYRQSHASVDDTFRRSSLGNLERAKIRTIQMTLLIVIVFIVCWTPYYVICLWYWIDKESAGKLDHGLQKALFIFACTNSCMNPMVYGIFNIRRRNNQSVNEGQSPRSGIPLQNLLEKKGQVFDLKKLKEKTDSICILCGLKTPPSDTLRR